jgi:hypothetical protein
MDRFVGIHRPQSRVSGNHAALRLARYDEHRSLQLLSASSAVTGSYMVGRSGLGAKWERTPSGRRRQTRSFALIGADLGRHTSIGSSYCGALFGTK